MLRHAGHHAPNHARSAACRADVLAEIFDNPDVLAELFERLPIGDQCFTVSSLSKQWQLWAARKQSDAKGKAAETRITFLHLPLYQHPFWLVQKA